MIEIGRLCLKLAGRDANKKCVVIEILDDNYVTIDGETRRRKCNIQHIEPLNQVLNIKEGASHSEVVKEFKKLGMELKETAPKNAAEKPKTKRKIGTPKEKPVKEKKAPVKKEVKETKKKK